jgi:hypothetical protein
MNPRLPLAGLLAIAFIVVFELVFLRVTEPLSGLPLLQPTADDAVVIAKRSLLDDAAGNVAIIGDSSALHGLSPALMKSAGGRTFTNFGSLASLTMVGYSQLGMELLQREHAPSAILFAVLPQTLAIDFDKSNEIGQIPRYLVAYGRQGVSAPRYPIRSYVDWLVAKHRFNSFPPEFGASFVEFRDVLAAERGFFRERKQRVNRARVIDSFVPSPMSQASLNEVLEQAKDRSIPVLFMFNPKPDSIITGSYVADARQFLETLQREHPEVHVLRPDAPVWEERLFGTETHLNADGVTRNSAEVALLVERALAK